MSHGRESFAAALLMGIVVALAGCDRVYDFPSDPSVKLTEATAIDAARRALEKAGYHVNDVEPTCYSVPCRSTDAYFARSGPEANTGYILWRIKSRTDRLHDLNVRVTKTERYIRCEVGKVK